MSELLKFAQANNLTDEDLDYLFEQGLEKIASEQYVEELYDSFEKVAEAYGVDPETLDMLVQEGYEKVAGIRDFGVNAKQKLVEYMQGLRQAAGSAGARFGALPLPAKIGIGAGATAAGLGTAYGAHRLRANRREKEELAKLASALNEDDIEYVIAQGIEKVAEDLSY